MTEGADLEGMTVVSVEQAVAAPLASSRLADAGARVIKVERPEGDFARGYDRLVRGQSAYFVWLNRGKESICLDLRDAADRAVLRTMIASADVFIQNLRPGALSKYGFGGSELSKRHPSLVVCEISGFGGEGPCAGLKAYDLIVQAEAGLCSITGTEDGPARVGISVCDIAAGVTAHAAILQALIARSRTGEGRVIAVSLFGSLTEWMNVPLLQYAYSAHEVRRTGVAHPTIAPYRAFPTSDGVSLIISIQNEREWERFCVQVLGLGGLLADSRFCDNSARLAHRPVLDALVAERLATMSSSEACERLHAAGIAHGRLNGIPEAAGHPHLKHVTVSSPEGEISLIAPDATPVTSSLRVPALDEHGSALRAEFGWVSPTPAPN